MSTDHSQETSAFRVLFWALLLPLSGLLIYVGLMLGLATTHPFEVTLGQSMQPMLHTGDLAVMGGLGPRGVELGDVVALSVNAADRARFGYPDRVLHRVIDITFEDGRLVVLTKGDNQDAPDPFVTPVSEITSRLQTHVPKLGYVLFYLHSTQGKVALAGLLLLFLLYEGVRWFTDTAEELIDDGGAPSVGSGGDALGGLDQFTGAIAEYGVHLRSHTRIVQGLGDTTEELRDATSMQREVIAELRDSVRTLGERLAATEAPPARLIEAVVMPAAATPDSPLAPLPAPPALPGDSVAPPAPIAIESSRTRGGELRPRYAVDLDAAALKRPILFMRVVAFVHGRLHLDVRGFVAQDELLRFGAALALDHPAGDVALESADENGGAFTIATGDPLATVERVHRMPGFSVHLTATEHVESA